MTSESIDGLLARYLGLLHEYTELRGQLSTHQASMFGNLARANFAAERGFRYGPDHFDGRMQALVRLNIAEDSKGTEPAAASFAVARPRKGVKADVTDDKESKESLDLESDEKKYEAEDADNTTTRPMSRKSNQTKKPSGPRDPLQWFGVLTPMALRQAQQEAIEVIDNIVPRLAALSAEMAAVEIEVRRARKKRARAVVSQQRDDKSTETATKTEATVSV
ncbi:hypothetical protein SPBR_02040 [Sporothrix brasiliensis 5110]|uniref:Vacuolar ATPase assembly protein VMA22 n=1 Tax=Sporothrix brasiliensis 5110 TaxID=1398154 RepID=A0A0C2EZB9_9PEZI|nr:uncharacterized protein SPBR_02040 [Sporothrix brasiliensis 5110]KIH91854.1 hypothetical protein SPBR_02040 [Sporothrix brasiliensis 5110]